MNVLWVVGKIVGLKQNTVTDKIKEIEQKFKEISENPQLEIPIKYEFLKQKIKEISEFIPIYYNHHYINILKDDNTHFGKLYKKKLLNFTMSILDSIQERILNLKRIPDYEFTTYEQELYLVLV